MLRFVIGSPLGVSSVASGALPLPFSSEFISRAPFVVPCPSSPDLFLFLSIIKLQYKLLYYYFVSYENG